MLLVSGPWLGNGSVRPVRGPEALSDRAVLAARRHRTCERLRAVRDIPAKFRSVGGHGTAHSEQLDSFQRALHEGTYPWYQSKAWE